MEVHTTRSLRSKISAKSDKTTKSEIKELKTKIKPEKLSIKKEIVKKSPSDKKTNKSKNTSDKEVKIKSEYVDNQSQMVTEIHSSISDSTTRKRPVKTTKEDVSAKSDKTAITDVKEVETKIKREKLSIKKEILKKSSSEKTKNTSEKEVKIKSEYFDDQNQIESQASISDSSNRKRPAKITKEDASALKPEKTTKMELEPQNTPDIEDGVWRPDNWREVLDNILKMRKMYVAPVDSLGCEECPEEGAPAIVFRYQTLISVMLSSQTRDEVTFAASQRLIEHGLTVDNILDTPDEKIGELIYPAGFWKSKVKFIKNTSKILKDQYDGDIPRTFKELCKLPGVGPKMANIVMSVAWNDTVGIAVDTHVHRISNRLGWVPKPTKEPEQTRKALESWLPKDQWGPINVTLVGFGQTVCRPVGPSCEVCLNKDLCPFGKSVLSSKVKQKKRNT